MPVCVRTWALEAQHSIAIIVNTIIDRLIIIIC